MRFLFEDKSIWCSRSFAVRIRVRRCSVFIWKRTNKHRTVSERVRLLFVYVLFTIKQATNKRVGLINKHERTRIANSINKRPLGLTNAFVYTSNVCNERFVSMVGIHDILSSVVLFNPHGDSALPYKSRNVKFYNFQIKIATLVNLFSV